MLDARLTGSPGVTLSVPTIIDMLEIDYLALTASGPMHALPQFAPPKIAELAELMKSNGIPDGMPNFFRYRRFAANGDVELEIGTAVTKPAPEVDGLVRGLLPAGRYATATLFGPYDRLYDAFLMLNGWIEGRGQLAAATEERDGTRPECQLEVYRIGPKQQREPALYETDILIKLA